MLVEMRQEASAVRLRRELLSNRRTAERQEAIGNSKGIRGDSANL